MKINLIFITALILGAAIILHTYHGLTKSEIHHCLVTSSDKSICK